MKSILVNNNGLIVGILIGMSTMYILIEFKRNCWISTDANKMKSSMILKLVRQTARYSSAALQDKSPLIALLHANYGTGYLWALKSIATNDEIRNITKIDLIQI